eukprot:4962342-Pleurochrysis_carterae.AAC.1
MAASSQQLILSLRFQGSDCWPRAGGGDKFRREERVCRAAQVRGESTRSRWRASRDEARGRSRSG